MRAEILAWALARPTGDRWRCLADAFVGGSSRVTFDGRTVEYRSIEEMSVVLAAGYGAENVQARRPSATFASFTREGGS
jgi:hypothetical protein